MIKNGNWLPCATVWPIWNRWRKEHPEKKINLKRADLRGANLFEADLTRADLSGANLNEADLTRADLSEADLSKAELNVGKPNIYKSEQGESSGAFLS